MSILVNRPDNKRRPPDWRWQRATEIVLEGSRLVAGRDDQIVRGLCNFRRKLDRVSTDDQQLALLDENPALWEAHNMYVGEDTPVEARWELEAFLLCHEWQPHEVAAHLGIDEAVVIAYEKCFYDVTSRLQYQSLILHAVIGRAVQTGLAERQHDCLWKLFGYWGGPLVLDAYIHKFNRPQRPETVDGVGAFNNDCVRHMLGTKALVSAMTMPVNWNTQTEILHLWKELMMLELQAGQAGGGSDAYYQNIDAMVACFQFLKYRPGVDPAPTNRAARLEEGGVRMRADELAMIGMGKEPQGLEHLVAGLTFPAKGETDEQNAQTN